MSRYLISAIALLLTLVLSSCDHEDDEDSAATQRPPAAGAVSSVPTAAASCNIWVALDFIAETGQESEVLPSLTGCTNVDLTKTYLHNAHESMVWLIDRPLLTWTVDHPDPTIQIFRDGIARARQPGLTLEPGQGVTLDAAPSDVHLTLDPAVQSAWQLRKLSARRGEGQGRRLGEEGNRGKI